MELQLNETSVLNNEKLSFENLLKAIKNSKSSQQWPQKEKLKILKSVKDKNCKQQLQQAWVTQQLREVEGDPLEEQVVDESGTVLASRHWKCNARSCNNQHFKGNCTKLVIRVDTSDRCKLVYNTKDSACLKHYVVVNKDKDYCHNYFKVHKQLPERAFLNLAVQDKQVPLGHPKVPIPVPSCETKQTEGKITQKL